MVDLLRRSNQKTVEDEWYIPYKSPVTPVALRPPSYSGIGQSPSPARVPPGSIFGYFQNATAQSLYADKYAKSPTQSSNRIPFPPSDSALTPPHPLRIPTDTSVPTGLSAPKLLFSPLSREVRGVSQLRSDGAGTSEETIPRRQRVMSEPGRRFHEQPTHWGVNTMCDKFVLAKPSITPLVITPPASPERADDDLFSRNGEKAMREMDERRREREEWSDYVKRRGRSHSFGATTRPAGPIIGNARARGREFEQRRSLDERKQRRSSSLSSKWRPGFVRRWSQGDGKRPSMESEQSGASSSFGFIRKMSSTSRLSDLVKDASVPEGRHASYRNDATRPAQLRNDSRHKHTRSSPDLLGPTAPRRTGPPRTLRIQQPPAIRQGFEHGVVVIGPGSSTYRGPTAPRPRRVTHSSLDLSKPLPPLPPQQADRSPEIANVGPFTSLADDMKATTPPQSTPDPDRSRRESVGQSPAHARAILAKQHQMARTKKAFQAPSSGRSNRLSGTPQSRHAELIPVSPTPTRTTRKKTALEEAIERSKPASIADTDNSSASHLPPPSDTHSSQEKLDHGIVLQKASPEKTNPRDVPELGYPIASSSRQKVNFLAPPSAPPIFRNDTSQSAASQQTVYTDASEGWDREFEAEGEVVRRSIADDTPSPEVTFDESDFKNLFFRTPQDVNEAFPSPPRSTRGNPQSRFPRPVSGQMNQGLGFDLEQPRSAMSSFDDPRRPSEGSAYSGATKLTTSTSGLDTMGISTPITHSDMNVPQPAVVEASVDSVEYPRPRDLRESSDFSLRFVDEGDVGDKSASKLLTAVSAHTINADPSTPPRATSLGGRRLGSKPSLELPKPHYVDINDRPSIHNTASPALSPGTFGAVGTEYPDPFDNDTTPTRKNTPPPTLRADISPTIPISPFQSSTRSPDRYTRPGRHQGSEAKSTRGRLSFSANDARRPSHVESVGGGSRYSAVPSFVDDFPSPPLGA